MVVYDVKNKEILSKASLITKDAFETFPAFSPDGKWLYFCTAPAQKMPENYDKVRYNCLLYTSSLYFYDMFWKRRKMEATIYDDTFHRQDISYSPTRTFGIGISYRFGNLKDAIKKVKRGIKNDDVKALESGS